MEKDRTTQVPPEGPGQQGPTEAAVIVIAHPDPAVLGRRFRLGPGEQLEIGRSGQVAASFPDVLEMSRLHARLRYIAGSVFLEDLGSTNRTWVEGQQLAGRRELRSGERFQVASVHFKLLREQDVENAYHAIVYDLMTRDGLTGVHNRRKLEEEGRREVARARRYQRPLSLILIDLDHFKRVNDERGHPCGDRVLQAVARALSGLLRVEEIFARVGGEEFAALCPETPLQGASMLAERLCAATSQLEHVDGEDRFRITSSLGVASLLPEMRGFEELYEAADKALYEAKRTGRDRVVVSGG